MGLAGHRDGRFLAYMAALAAFDRFQNSATSTTRGANRTKLAPSLSLIPTTSACVGPAALRSSERHLFTHQTPQFEQCPRHVAAKPKKRDNRAKAS
jgi:hypothetical protein